MKFTISTLPGDGIGPEIVDSAQRVLNAAQEAVGGFELDFQRHEAGAEHYRRTGVMLPDPVYTACEESHAIFLGAIGLPDVREPSGIEVGGRLMFRIRFGLGLFAGVRPLKLYPGVSTPLVDPGALDFVIVRESTEGLFASYGGGAEVEDQVVSDTMLITREGTERVVEEAFSLSQKRHGRPSDGQRVVTVVDKSNVFRSMAFFQKVAYEVAERHAPSVAVNSRLVDAMALLLVQEPDQYDVLVMENMYGDILSDLGAAVVGGMGMAPSGDIGRENAMFQPAHGSAPTIAGQGIANPCATILSGRMMLDWLAERHSHDGVRAAARRVEDAVASALGEGFATRDIGGTSSTEEFTAAVVERVGS